jgi:hypothetical protein
VQRRALAGGAKGTTCWIVLSFALCTLLATAPVARAASPDSPPPPVGSPYQLNLGVDIPVLVVSTALWVVPWALTTNEQPPSHCDPCDRSKVNGFDRLTIDMDDHASRTAANALLGALPISVAIAWADYGIADWRNWGTDVIVIGETYLVSGALDELVRRAVRRPRPYMYRPGAEPKLRKTAEGSLSFFSGHTAALYAMAVSTSYTYGLRHPQSPWRLPLWIGLLGIATAEGALRVASGDHFMTDVLTGALVGVSSGFAVTTLHLRPAPFVVVPSVSSQSASLSLIGDF